jgi:hypothetical protein
MVIFLKWADFKNGKKQKNNLKNSKREKEK